VAQPVQSGGNGEGEERWAALVLGIGNLLWADEGFGVRCVEALHERWELPASVQVLDGGTQGLYLVSDVGAADRLLVFDALDYGDPPGTLRVVRGDEVPRFAGVKKMSLHQTGFQEVLAAASLLDRSPQEVTLIGVQAAQLEDFGGSLTPLVAGRLDEALALAVAELSAWGLAPRRRTEPAPPLGLSTLSRERYERERPAPELACRVGDDRFLPAAESSPAPSPLAAGGR
jgi:hydrogenase maturation protease